MRLPTWGWALLCATWLAAVLGGFGAMFRWKSVAGEEGAAPARWPSASTLPHAPDRPTLMMFVHPHCVCSRASLTELNRLLSQVRDRVAAMVVLVRPVGVETGWEADGLGATAARIPGVTVLVDDGGVEAKRFGANTSGSTLLYAQAGELSFAGGITSMRAHEGESLGEHRIIDFINRGTADRDTAPVFGCALHDAAKSTTESRGPSR